MHARLCWSDLTFRSLAVVFLLAPAIPAQEEKKDLEKGRRMILLQTAATMASDFGPLEDGKEKSQEALVKQGWTYLFDSRIPKEGPKWNPMGLWRVRNPGEPQRNLWSAVEEEGQRILKNIVPPGGHGTDLISLQEFRDFDLHVELRVPENSNSGIYLRGRYEIQVLSTPTPEKQKEVGMVDLGAIYSVKAPSVNASKGPGVWQTIDASIRGFKVTVRLNGQAIQDNVEIPENRRGGTGSELGPGDGIYSSDPGSPGPIFLQGDHGTVDFRNVRIRPSLDRFPQVEQRIQRIRRIDDGSKEGDPQKKE